MIPAVATNVRNRLALCLRCALCVLFSFCLSAAGASQGTVAVLYPEVKEPYRRIFLDIVEGIKSESGASVKVLELTGKDDLASIGDWLEKESASAVISLGNRGKSIARDLPPNYSVITGASVLSSQNIEDGLLGISLTPAPEKLFRKIAELMPSIKRIRVVYHKQTNEWLIRIAQQSAQELGLELIAVDAADVREAATSYREALATDSPETDAIWLLQGDPTLDERSLLPTLLSQAWTNNLVIFSSNPSHVKRGALFSLFPDNGAMGKSLARKLQRVANGEEGSSEPLHDLRIAVNVRTAEHLKIKISRSQERAFDLVFPNR